MDQPVHVRFAFVSEALEPDSFHVASFEGEEAISSLYRFEIELLSRETAPDIDAILEAPARLELDDGTDVSRFHGLVTEFEQREQGPVYARYRAVLRPRLCLATYRKQSQIHQETTVPDIVKTELANIDLNVGDLVDDRISGKYPEREYVVQYQETDHDFISRLMEHEGIFYFFEEGDSGEVLVLADANSATQEIRGGFTLPYIPPSGLESSNTPCIRQLVGRQQRIPDKVILKDYNYRVPKVALEAESKPLGEGKGFVTAYGDHFKTVQEGKALAQVRAEELAARKRLFVGESNCVRIRSGARYELTEHYRTDFDQEYLITEVRHRGVQPLPEEIAGDPDAIDRLDYGNDFTSLAADVPFRPARVTPKPRLDGVMNARVDAGGSGEYAEIDDEGRYKLVLPFDPVERDGGRASRYVRMAQPYSGAGYGMHFPLHKGAEVLVTCVDGDPDRPIICGTVPNPENQSPVTGANQTQAKIRTGGGNQITMEDENGNQRIKMETPFNGTVFQLGSPNLPWAGAALKTAGGALFDVTQNWEQYVEADQIKRIKGNSQTYIAGYKHEDILGGKKEFVQGGGKIEIIALPGKSSNILGFKHETVVGLNIKANKAKDINVTREAIAEKADKIVEWSQQYIGKAANMQFVANTVKEKADRKDAMYQYHISKGNEAYFEAEEWHQEINQLYSQARKIKIKAKLQELTGKAIYKGAFKVNSIFTVKD
ncbi:MAG: type VI secretion system Vgr family protein [Myxococcota bacterium]